MKGSRNREAALEFIADLLGTRRQARARAAGFGLPVRSLFAAALAVATAVALSFLLLPIVAIFLQIPLGQLLDGMTAPAAVDALLVTLKTNADRERPDPALRYADRVSDRDAQLPRPRTPRHRRRAAARAAAGRRRDRAPRRVRAGRPARRHARILRARDRVHADRRRPGGDVRCEPVLPPRRRSRRSRPSTPR